MSQPSRSKRASSSPTTIKMNDSSEEGSALLHKFTAPSKPKPRSSISSQARAEKGTIKVNDHAAKEHAAKLLYTLIEGFKIEDEDVKKLFLKSTTKDVEKVISAFGFDKNRIQTESKQETAETIKNITISRDFKELNDTYKSLGPKLESLQQSLCDNREGSVESSSEVRTTRSGSHLKRNRDVQDATEYADKIAVLLKRIRE